MESCLPLGLERNPRNQELLSPVSHSNPFTSFSRYTQSSVCVHDAHKVGQCFAKLTVRCNNLTLAVHGTYHGMYTWALSNCQSIIPNPLTYKHLPKESATTISVSPHCSSHDEKKTRKAKILRNSTIHLTTKRVTRFINHHY